MRESEQHNNGFLPNGIRPGLFFFGDNLAGLQKLAAETIDLIYLDPPFNSKKQWSGVIAENRAQTEVAFKDNWTMDDIKPQWLNRIRKHSAVREVAEAVRATAGEAAMAYILYMAIRLIEMHRVLKPSGSIYYHCDPVMSHSVKLLMDAIFGAQNFRNEVIWCYANPSNLKTAFARKHDTIFFYAKSAAAVFNWQDVAMAHKRVDKQVSGGWHKSPKSDGDIQNKKCPDWWTDITPAGKLAKERIGYPTQKPEALLERIILASSNEGDVVLDPFAGSGTACAVAEKLNRRRIGMDLNETAARAATSRLKKINANQQPAQSINQTAPLPIADVRVKITG